MQNLKKLLQAGYVVELKNGMKGIVMPTKDGMALVFKHSVFDIDKYADDLKFPEHKQFDIVKIYGLTDMTGCITEPSIDGRELIWSAPKSTDIHTYRIHSDFGGAWDIKAHNAGEAAAFFDKISMGRAKLVLIEMIS